MSAFFFTPTVKVLNGVFLIGVADRDNTEKTCEYCPDGTKEVKAQLVMQDLELKAAVESLRQYQNKASEPIVYFIFIFLKSGMFANASSYLVIAECM